MFKNKLKKLNIDVIRKTNYTIKLNDAILALNEQGLTNHDIALAESGFDENYFMPIKTTACFANINIKIFFYFRF